MAGVLLLLAMTVVPFGGGFVLGRRGGAWAWAAAVAVVLFLLAAVVPEPEAGESRLAWGDVPFLAVVTALIVALAWAGAVFGSRSRGGRPAP